MILIESSSQTKRFRKSPWLFQKTFRTPLKALPSFVAEILRPNLIKEGVVTIESTASAPRNLAALLELHSLAVPTGPDQGIKAVDTAAVSDLLEAALADPIDFWFVPSPKVFALYADNDEYVTFFANKKGALAAVADGFAAKDVKCVETYERKL